jgi:hypothetical protein
MNELKRLVLDFRTDELVIRTLYRTEGGSSAGPNTKARRRGAQDLTREGLPQALASLEGARCLWVLRDSPQGRMFFWPRPHQMQTS